MQFIFILAVITFVVFLGSYNFLDPSRVQTKKEHMQEDFDRMGKEFFVYFDQNKDGKVLVSEVVKARVNEYQERVQDSLDRAKKQTVEGMAREEFKKVDLNADDKVTLREMREAMRLIHTGKIDPPKSYHDI